MINHRARRLRIERLEERRVLSVTTLTSNADTYTRAGANAGAAEVLDVLANSSTGDYAAYVRFDLSGLSLDSLTAATLRLYKTGASRNDTIVTDRFDVYGLTARAGNTPQDWSEATLAEGNPGGEYAGGALDLTRLFNLDQESGAGVFESVVNADGAAQEVTGPDLVAFLQSRAADGGLATFVTHVDTDAVRGWGYTSREATDEALRPQLVLEFEDDPIDDPYPEDPVVLPRQAEKLDRGLVALRRSSGEVYLGWRLLGDDPADVAFNVYRATRAGGVKLNAFPLTQTTDFVDASANLATSNAYYVRPVVDGVELPASKTYLVPANAEIEQHLTIPLQIPDPVTTSDGVTHYYTANDASVGDLDGDGDYEVIVKWNGEPADLFELSANMYVDAYDLDGALLWRIDVGPNLKTIASSLQFIVYDFDGDGRAEVAMNTSDGTVSGTGEVLGDPDADWRNPDGWVTTGPEFLTVFDGLTGGVLATTPLQPARGDVTDWGDSYGHRSTTHKYTVAYLDGQRPSLVTGRGIYHGQAGRSKTELVAWDWRNSQLTDRWTFTATEGTGRDTNPEYVGQGNQAVSVADVDGDGFDEVVWGAMVVDHDGAGLYSTGRGHGDALHVADMDPDNPGLEIFEPHENPGEYGDAGGDYRDAMTGQLLYGIPATGDVGRGVAFDIDPNYPGFEFWASINDSVNGTPTIYNVQQGAIYPAPANIQYNFAVWWDADPLRELLDGTTISKWRYDWASPGRQNLVSFANSGINSTAGLSSNNGTKATPALSADILGDWREEVIWRRSDNSALEIWSTTIAASMRVPTLMHDSQYRQQVATQNIYYNQPPHPSYFLGAGMDTPPTPPLFFGGELEGDYNHDGAVDAADYTVWRDTLGSTDDLSADGDHSGVVDQPDLALWRRNYGATATQAPVAAPAFQPAERNPREAPLSETADAAFALFSRANQPDASATLDGRSDQPAERPPAPILSEPQQLLLHNQRELMSSKDEPQVDASVVLPGGDDPSMQNQQRPLRRLTVVWPRVL
ncbi:Rhamnogalacturonan endolyase YesW precursor [Posidoniimonas corsicana]|uniref:Rhamnogalacturonan endolyase YesW n=1 Tax=Posidoniimonas corsicana TaxID=1938618 RepID=A0A5C5VEN7_9BACT|nr:DNRLRE domain-containing protein [Posidoniimonas corsicana]TWT37098.1 Rhamnogalacturonan endolyase YesW precursor [Posidoniimonas corsicana]